MAKQVNFWKCSEERYQEYYKANALVDSDFYLVTDTNGNSILYMGKMKLTNEGEEGGGFITTNEMKEYVTGELEKIDFPEQVQVDWNQNEESKLDYIKNRPFYEKPIEAKWNNTISETELSLKVNVAFTTSTIAKYKKVSDIILQEENFSSCYINNEVLDNGKIVSYQENGYYVYDTKAKTVTVSIVDVTVNLPSMFIVQNEKVDLATCIDPETSAVTIQSCKAEGPGIYVLVGGQYDTDITLSVLEIKKIDEKFIPETIARTETVKKVETKVEEVETSFQTEINNLAPIAKSGSINDLNVNWDTVLIFDGGDADVQLAILDETILL